MPNSHMERRHNTKTILWCAPGSRTYIILEIVASTAGTAVQALLETAHTAIMTRIENIGDGPVSSGVFRIGGDENIVLYTRNANNHQQTWGVIGAALGALQDYMNHNGELPNWPVEKGRFNTNNDLLGFGQAAFDVFDGENEIATGTIGYESPPCFELS